MNINVNIPVLKRLLIGSIGTLICCTALASAASAESKGDRRSVTVFYGDLNLANPVGVQRLYERIRQAALQVCNGSRNFGPLSLRRDAKGCTQHAIDEAVQSIDNRVLTALHQEKASRRVS